MRATLGLLLAAALAGCADSNVKDCTKLAGPGWSVLKQPPANAQDLLNTQSLPGDAGIIWLARGDDHLMACYYATSLTNPACGGSRAYEFAQAKGRWTSRGTLLDFCDNNPDTEGTENQKPQR